MKRNLSFFLLLLNILSVQLAWANIGDNERAFQAYIGNYERIMISQDTPDHFCKRDTYKNVSVRAEIEDLYGVSINGISLNGRVTEISSERIQLFAKVDGGVYWEKWPNESGWGYYYSRYQTRVELIDSGYFILNAFTYDKISSSWVLKHTMGLLTVGETEKERVTGEKQLILDGICTYKKLVLTNPN